MAHGGAVHWLRPPLTLRFEALRPISGYDHHFTTSALETFQSMSNKLNIDGIMLFEQPFARVSKSVRCITHQSLTSFFRLSYPVLLTQVPFENYRKVFRTSQKNIEKEFGPIQIAANELTKQAQTGFASSEETVTSIDNMINRIENLKRRVCFSNVGGTILYSFLFGSSPSRPVSRTADGVRHTHSRGHEGEVATSRNCRGSAK